MSFHPPLRILLVTARPEETGFIDPRSTAHQLFDEMQEQMEAGAVVIEILRPPTLQALRHRLKDTTHPVHLLHFDGHGTFGEASIHQNERHKGDQGKLAFENAENKLALVEASVLAQVLQDSGVRLVVLDACQSAMGSADDAFSSIAARLIQGGVDAVIAMSTSVLVVSSTLYMGAFYRELALGTSIPVAQERARQALHDDSRRHLSRRRRDEEGSPVELHDWWLPHYYQQRPLAFSSTKPARKSKRKHTQSPIVRLNEQMPGEPRYGFSGRSRELLHLERWLEQNKLVVIHGFGGVGKTALAREAADWFTRTHLYEGACFISFEQGGDVLTVLSTLGLYLNIYDENYNPGEVQATLTRLQPVLRTTRILIIIDNLETILAQGDIPLESSDLAQLWETLLALTSMGVGMILTSRDLSFGDGRLAPGQHIRYIPLFGLWPDDAYALATQILLDLGIARTRAPYNELRTLLAELDHHPLAIQLVLPALRDCPLATIRADFTTLLPTFVDNTTIGANRSLLASLEYSLRRIPPEQRMFLSLFAIFEGGTHEEALLKITEIPMEIWATLRPALEQAALLMIEQVHQALSRPFVHFHPVLIPYLRLLTKGHEDEALRKRYASYYATLAYTFDYVRQTSELKYSLGRHELPNLRTALTYLLQAGDLDTASYMASSFANFLTDLGLIRERDRLRQRMNQILKASSSEELTPVTFQHEIGRAHDEQHSGKLQSAITRLTKLLARVQALPDGTAIGPGTYAHIHTLQVLGQCLEEVEQPLIAQQHLQRALDLLNVELMQNPDDLLLRVAHANLLGNLGNVYSQQGRYPQAQMYYEQAWQEHKAAKDTRNAAVALGELGTLALLQQDYSQAHSYYQRALQQFQFMGNLEQQASAWHQLGIVAQMQDDLSEAERCYRESLTLYEHIGYTTRTAGTFNQLAFIAKSTGRPEEAEGWFKKALECEELGGMHHALILQNLTDLLVSEVQAGHADLTRLAEARSYLEQCGHIEEQISVTGQTARTYGLLARIAELEELPEVAKDYLRHARESFAASADNRFQIDQQLASTIAAIAAAARGDTQARAQVTKALPTAEQEGWHISEGVQRIWQGERDWQILAEGLDGKSALLLLRVLEVLAEGSDTVTNTRLSE